MYQLYYGPGMCSMAVHIALVECGATFELKPALKPGTREKTEDFLKTSPRGSVPVLVEDGKVIREGGAQLVYLLDKHQSPLMPKEGFARATALEWLMFANATMHPAYSRAFFLMGQTIDATSKDQLQKTACDIINKYWQEVEEVLGTRKYIAGDQPTAADILLTVIANWSPRMPNPITLGVNCKRLFRDISSRPSYQQALKSEGVEYQVAA